MLVSQRRTKTRDGNVAVLVAVLLTVLIGMVGFAIDGGAIMSEKRHAQTTADAAAMAAVCIFYTNWNSIQSGGSFNQNNSENANARAEAKAVAAANGYLDDGSTSTKAAGTSIVTVNFPPNITGGSIYNNSTPATSYDGNLSDGCAEVLVTYYQRRYFTSIWGSDSITIAGRAVAKGAFVAPKNGVLVLNYTAGQALSDKGGGTINITGGNFVVNSNSSSAAVITGGGTITAPEFDVTGGLSFSGGGATLTTSPTSGQIFSGTHPLPDPLAFLPTPTQPTAGTITQTGMSGNIYTFTPGSYTKSTPNWPGNMTNGDQIVFSGNGIYWFDADIKVPGGQISMASGTQGVMIYMNSGSFNVNGGGGGINLAGLPTGTFGGSEAYEGMLYWQPKTNPAAIGVEGNGSVNISGTFYAPSPDVLMTVTGNGTGATGNTFGSQFVVNSMKVAGNGVVDIAWNGPQAAKTRIITLVE